MSAYLEIVLPFFCIASPLCRSGEPTFLSSNYLSLIPSQTTTNSWTADGPSRPYVLATDAEDLDEEEHSRIRGTVI